MGESTRPQIKPRYFLRYTPVSVADARLSTTEWEYQLGHYHHNYYYRISLLLLAVRNKPTTTYSPRDTEARLEHSPKTERKTRREKRRREGRRREIKRTNNQPPQK